VTGKPETDPLPRILGLRSSPERGRVGRAILVFLHFFDGLFRWNHPFQAVMLIHSAEDKRRTPGDQGQKCTHEIRGIDGGGFLRLASINVFQHFGKARLAGTEMGDVRVVALDQLGQCRTFRIRRVVAFHNGARRVLFWWVKLGKARSLNTRLPIVTSRGDLLLFQTILDDPDLRAVVIRSEANNHDLKNWIIRRKIEFVVQLSDQGTELFEESDANGFQVRLTLAGRLVTGVSSRDVLKIAVHSNGLGISGNTPFRSTEKYADVSCVKVQDAWRNGISLHGLIDGREDDDILGNVNDGPAAGEIGDDFVLVLFLGESIKLARAEDAKQNQEGESPRNARTEAWKEPLIGPRNDTSEPRSK
jgi:hypothetical protein